VDGVYVDWGSPDARKIDKATPDELDAYDFAAGSMGPKVEAACAFVRETGKRAAIGSLADIEAIVAGEAGTIVEPPKITQPKGTKAKKKTKKVKKTKKAKKA
jgi:carbamate kinase